MAKRLICVIISVLMIVSLLPTTAFAEVDEDSSTQIEAVAEEEDTGDDDSADSTGEEDENDGIMLTSDEGEEEGLDEGAVEGGEIAIPDDTVEIQRDGYTISGPSLGDVEDEIEDGDTITLIADSESGSVTIEATGVTIDLAGYSLSESITIANGASVT
ncbi:MAG: hypothetical protein LUE31_04265, partial [Lachnospiraceae bacterium]|nr:hypothetical protein [Lachnospiraceae bacterium]